MSTIPKHEAGPTKTRKRKSPSYPAVAEMPTPQPTPQPTQRTRHDVNVDGLSGIEYSLDNLVNVVGRLTSDNHAVSLSSGHGVMPVKVTLADDDEGDTMDRLVTAVERIADSLARIAGLNRPRLESWHEQDQYTPRYKDNACDGGAPGPKAIKVEGAK